MQLERNGNYLIEDIKFLKKYIVLVIDGEGTKISESTYSHFYLYKGRNLSQEELDEILEYERKAKIKEYMFSLVTRGLYSEKQIKNKLIKKKIAKKDTDELIKEFKEKGYINDDLFLNEKIEILERKKYGKNKIISALIEDGINKEKILQYDFPFEREKALKVLEKYMLSHKDYNLNQMKQGAYNHLLSHGFENDDASFVLNKKMANYDVDESKLIKKAFEKYVLLHHLDLNDVKDKEKVVSYLMRKGYHYDDISVVIRRNIK